MRLHKTPQSLKHMYKMLAPTAILTIRLPAASPAQAVVSRLSFSKSFSFQFPLSLLVVFGCIDTMLHKKLMFDPNVPLPVVDDTHLIVIYKIRPRHDMR
jgi:hypothetical protein